jgi:hypothetical protein
MHPIPSQFKKIEKTLNSEIRILENLTVEYREILGKDF